MNMCTSVVIFMIILVHYSWILKAEYLLKYNLQTIEYIYLKWTFKSD